jgi:3-hydroxy-3-methylglutaryl CoA synthase
MIGINGYGAYVPRLRMDRTAIGQANAWYAPALARAKGTRSLANWDEDAITMAVAAARDCLGADEDRSAIRCLHFASTTLPFVERLNAGIVAEALTLDEDVEARDATGSQRVALACLGDALAHVRSGQGDALVLAADARKTRAASPQELSYGDGAAVLRLGREGVIAEHLGSAAITVDFVDRFRMTGEEIDYHWEERWVRDEGVARLMPRAIAAALAKAGIEAATVDHFIFPTSFARMEAQLARACGIKPEAVVDGLSATVGDTGAGHGLMLLAGVLERAKPGEIIVLAQFGSGAEAVVFRATDQIGDFRPRVGLDGWLRRGVVETNYTKFLSFKGQLALERGMRGEQDRKTALSTAWRHRRAILGLVAGRCEKTGQVHFPPSRLSCDQDSPALDTQKPYKLAERRGRVLSWSAEHLSFHMSPPNHYGQVDFEGGGRILMEFTDIAPGEVDVGLAMDMVFRVKDIDEKRGYTRYFWKATPVREQAAAKVAAIGEMA